MFFIMYKGAKKAHKSYKKHQAQKSARKELPEIKDPSKELDTSCEATRRDSLSSGSSDSSSEVQKALENDPEFRKFIEKQKSLYLSQHRTLPPTYQSVIRESSAGALSPVNCETPNSLQSPAESHCNCHVCQTTLSPSTPKSGGPHAIIEHRPGFSNQSNEVYELMDDSARVELPGQMSESESAQQMEKSDHDSQVHELPAELPATYPSSHSPTAVELPTEKT